MGPPLGVNQPGASGPWRSIFWRGRPLFRSLLDAARGRLTEERYGLGVRRRGAERPLPTLRFTRGEYASRRAARKNFGRVLSTRKLHDATSSASAARVLGYAGWVDRSSQLDGGGHHHQLCVSKRLHGRLITGCCAWRRTPRAVGHRASMPVPIDVPEER